MYRTIFFSNPTNMQFCVDRGVEVTLVHQKTQDKDLDNGYNMFGGQLTSPQVNLF